MPVKLGSITDPQAFLDELARRDFVSFLMRAFAYVNGGADLDPNWHLDALAYQSDACAREAAGAS